jgi:hypothetical protein
LIVNDYAESLSPHFLHQPVAYDCEERSKYDEVGSAEDLYRVMTGPAGCLSLEFPGCN